MHVNPSLRVSAERLRKAFPNFTPDQVERQQYSVKVHFKGTELDVDVVPILYSGLGDLKIEPLIHSVFKQGQHGYDQSTTISGVSSTPNIAQRFDILDVS